MTEKFQHAGGRIITGILLLLVSVPTFAQSSAEQAFDERAIRTMLGRPAIAIVGGAIFQGASAKITNRLTNELVRNAAELILRRNGVPVIPACDGADVNCAKLNVLVVASCTKTNLLPSDDRFCPFQVRVQYLENAYSIRPGSDPSGFSYREFCVTWEYPLLLPTVTSEKLLEDASRKAWTEALEQFSLYYLRANPK
jgi:hypothetical protein